METPVIISPGSGAADAPLPAAVIVVTATRTEYR